MSDWLFIALGVGLTVGTALFVASEFSLVALDPSQVVKDGARSRRVVTALKALSTQLSGAQVGITLTTVLLGYTAQPALARLLEIPLQSTPLRAASAAIATVVALVVINAFSMIFGELVPKNAAIARPLETARAVTPFMLTFTTVLRPVIATLNGAANAILRRTALASGRSVSLLPRPMFFRWRAALVTRAFP